MGVSRQEYWSGLRLSFPGDLPDPGGRTQISCIAGRLFTIRSILRGLYWCLIVVLICIFLMPHLEPDIAECEIKWALESITRNKASGGDGIPVELFQILKDDAVQVLHSICQQIWKTQQWPQDWKRSVFIPIPKKGNAKECSNYCTTALISHTSRVMLKILQA